MPDKNEKSKKRPRREFVYIIGTIIFLVFLFRLNWFKYQPVEKPISSLDAVLNNLAIIRIIQIGIISLAIWVILSIVHHISNGHFIYRVGPSGLEIDKGLEEIGKNKAETVEELEKALKAEKQKNEILQEKNKELEARVEDIPNKLKEKLSEEIDKILVEDSKTKI